MSCFNRMRQAAIISSLVFLGVFFSADTGLFAEGLISQAERAAKLEEQRNQALRMWWTGMFYLVNTDSTLVKEPPGKLYDLFHYASLSKTEKKSIFARRPRVKPLGELVEVDRVVGLEAQLVKLQSLIKRGSQRKTETLCEIVRKYQDEKLNLSDDAFDQLFGIDYVRTERTIQASDYGNASTWMGMTKAATQTPYSIIRKLFKDYAPSDNTVFYDLGSGYGRVLFYGACLFPRAKFKGIEIVRERSSEAQAAALLAKLNNVEAIPSDILKTDFSDGKVFYIFNSFPSIMGAVLEKLQQISKNRTITIITSGNTSAELGRIAWLKAGKSSGPNFRQLTTFESK